jgi:glycerol uptake facilitator-like aquaporin
MCGVCLYSVVYIFSPVSGGHFNPAVTIAVYISLAFNAHNIVLLFIMISAQLIGAFAGMALSRAFRVDTDGVNQALLYPQGVWFGSTAILVDPNAYF